jgi:hypothetical protein
MYCTKCGHQNESTVKFCSGCGNQLAAGDQQLSNSEQLGYLQLQSVYNPYFDLRKIPLDQREEFKNHTLDTTFPVAVVILLHFVTLGIFTFIHFGLLHSRLPIIKSDDFSGGKAIGFLFIPFFNIYWIFVFWGRLTDRINFQYKLRNQPAPISKGLVITSVAIAIIPYLGILSFIFLLPIVVGTIRSACNRLVIEKM